MATQKVWFQLYIKKEETGGQEKKVGNESFVTIDEDEVVASFRQKVLEKQKNKLSNYDDDDLYVYKDGEELNPRTKITFSDDSKAKNVIVVSEADTLKVIAKKDLKLAMTDMSFDQPREEASRIAQDFVASILKPLEEIGNGMTLMRNVPQLETNTSQNIIIRSITERFWQSCIELLNDASRHNRVCAVGTPGIGKTSSTPFLLRMLIEGGDTVVYHIRTNNKKGWYYEFSPGDGTQVNARAYPEKDDPDHIPSLSQQSTFYVVDPGATEDSCNPPLIFKPKTIIVASPDSRHWGGGEFMKMRGGKEGHIRFFPVWSLDELKDSYQYLNIESEAVVEKRYREVGGVPRAIALTEAAYRATMENQTRDIASLTEEHAKSIARGEMDNLSSLDSKQPKSSLIGYIETDDFSEKVAVISPFVAEKVYTKYIKLLWNSMESMKENGWKIFEAYCRCVILTEQEYSCRKCCGRKDKDYAKIVYRKLGGCHKIRLAVDIVEAASHQQETIFHSVSRSYELIDFIYRDRKNRFHAFQVTLGRTHSSKKTNITTLKDKVGNRELFMYYLVPGESFQTFVTNPVKPMVNKSCSIWHVLIPNPNEEEHRRG